jgi:hypothetical protein
VKWFSRFEILIPESLRLLKPYTEKIMVTVTPEVNGRYMESAAKSYAFELGINCTDAGFGFGPISPMES